MLKERTMVQWSLNISVPMVFQTQLFPDADPKKKKKRR